MSICWLTSLTICKPSLQLTSVFLFDKISHFIGVMLQSNHQWNLWRVQNEKRARQNEETVSKSTVLTAHNIWKAIFDSFQHFRNGDEGRFKQQTKHSSSPSPIKTPEWEQQQRHLIPPSPLHLTQPTTQPSTFTLSALYNNNCATRFMRSAQNKNSQH